MAREYYKFIAVIVFFAFISFMSVFTMVLIYEAGAEYVIDPIHNTTQTIANTSIDQSLGIGVSMNEAKAAYDNLNLPVDIFFVGIMALFFVTTMATAFKFPKVSIFSVIGLLFVGSVGLLFATLFVSDFVSWMLVEIFDKLFASSSINTPIFDYYVNNMGWINFFWWICLVFAAFLESSYLSFGGTVEE